jgi:hypothetical protein
MEFGIEIRPLAILVAPAARPARQFRSRSRYGGIRPRRCRQGNEPVSEARTTVAGPLAVPGPRLCERTRRPGGHWRVSEPQWRIGRDVARRFVWNSGLRRRSTLTASSVDVTTSRNRDPSMNGGAVGLLLTNGAPPLFRAVRLRTIGPAPMERHNHRVENGAESVESC